MGEPSIDCAQSVSTAGAPAHDGRGDHTGVNATCAALWPLEGDIVISAA